MPEATNLNHS